MICPLCNTKDAGKFHKDKYREYFRCVNCRLIFIPPKYFLSPEAEKAEYENHNNSPDDPKYRLFLSRLFNPMQKLLAPKSNGLDFGSGPGPTMSVMFEEAGHSMSLYDCFYAPDKSVLEKQYDFITATEVVEHLYQPKKELDMLWGCLKPNGYLCILTKLASELEMFDGWHYANELSHVCFFAKETFEWLAGQWYAEVKFVSEDVIVFRKK